MDHGNLICIAFLTLRPTDQNVILSLDKPLAPPLHHIIVVRGNLAPEGAVMKLSGTRLYQSIFNSFQGKELRLFQGPARVFDGEEAALDSILKGNIKKGDVVIIRYEGEMISFSSKKLT